MAYKDGNVCPETGRDLAGVDLQAHADTLWPAPLDERRPAHRTAILRRKKLLEGGIPPEEYEKRDETLIAY